MASLRRWHLSKNRGDTCRERVLVLSGMFKDSKEISVTRGELARRRLVDDEIRRK